MFQPFQHSTLCRALHITRSCFAVRRLSGTVTSFYFVAPFHAARAGGPLNTSVVHRPLLLEMSCFQRSLECLSALKLILPPESGVYDRTRDHCVLLLRRSSIRMNETTSISSIRCMGRAAADDDHSPPTKLGLLAGLTIAKIASDALPRSLLHQRAIP